MYAKGTQEPRERTLNANLEKLEQQNKVVLIIIQHIKQSPWVHTHINNRINNNNWIKIKIIRGRQISQAKELKIIYAATPPSRRWSITLCRGTSFQRKRTVWEGDTEQGHSREARQAHCSQAILVSITAVSQVNLVCLWHDMMKTELCLSDHPLKPSPQPNHERDSRQITILRHLTICLIRHLPICQDCQKQRKSEKMSQPQRHHRRHDDWMSWGSWVGSWVKSWNRKRTLEGNWGNLNKVWILFSY